MSENVFLNFKLTFNTRNFELIKISRKKEYPFHLLLDLNLVEPIHNLDVHLLLLDPLVHLGWQGNMSYGTYMTVYSHSLHCHPCISYLPNPTSLSYLGLFAVIFFYNFLNSLNLGCFLAVIFSHHFLFPTLAVCNWKASSAWALAVSTSLS